MHDESATSGHPMINLRTFINTASTSSFYLSILFILITYFFQYLATPLISFNYILSSQNN
jgi:hypothetical protein